MTLLEALLLIGVGILAGFINVLAGGGSLLTIPLLIFMGLPSSVANATNRLGIFTQNIFAVRGFKSKGVRVTKFAYWLTVSSCIGSLIGSFAVVDIPDSVFNRVFALVMVCVMVLIVMKPKVSIENQIENFSQRRIWLSIVLFFFIGIYGGFMQAGIGFPIIAALTMVHALPMTKVNSIKVFTALGYTTIALIVFIYHDLIHWKVGLTLAVGNAIGGWFTSRWSVSVPDKYLRWFLLVTVSVLAIKLWFFDR